MAKKYKYQINSKRGIIKEVERPAGTTPIRESRGAYDPKATYSKGDIVIYGGLYYTAITGQGVPGEGDGWEISGIVSAKGVTLSIRLDRPMLDITDGAKAVRATATATLGEQDITAGLPADGWRWTWRGKELSGETKSSVTLTDIPLEVGQYPLKATHKLFGTAAEVQVLRVDVTTKLRAELEEALEQLRKSTGDDQAAMAEILGKVNKTLTSLQEQVDKEVSNWFYPGPPAPDKEPESEWTTNQDKYRHIGDTYTSVDESGEYMGKSWRYTTEYKWQEIHDTLISKALSVAAKAQTTADGKSTTYYTQPSSYSVGDSWVLSADTTVGGKVYKKGTMLFASASSDVYVGAHWSERLKYIDSAKLEADLKASERKSKEAWEAYAAAKASKAGADAVKAAKEYAEAQDAAYETRTKAYADQIVTDKEQALIAAADAKAALAEKRAKAYADGKVTQAEQLAIDKAAAAYKAAIKKAKELDSEIQVGGRNLAIMSRMIPGYLYGDIKIGNPGDRDYKVIQYKDFIYDPTYYEWDGATPLTFKLYKGGTSAPIIHYHDKDKVFIGWSFDWMERPAGYTKTLTPPAATAYIRIGFPCADPIVKLERGTVATDWTPAPEDLQAEIDAINANPPRISAGGTWEVYVPREGKYIDTGRTSKGDNGKAPIIKGDNWWEWDAKAGKYTDTGVRAIGVKGDKGDKGDGLEVIDTRNDNQPPSWYREKYAQTTVREFKKQSTLEIPSEWRSGTYCTLETTVRWGDTSGGRVEQSTTLDNGTQLRRVGTADDTAWEPWINVSAEIRELESGLSSANSSISALQTAKEEIEKGKLSISDLPKNLKWIYDAFHNGETQVEGGLILSKYIGLSNSADKVTSYLSGQDGPGAHMLAAGVSSLADQDAVSYINYDGSAKFGDLTIDEHGGVMITNAGRDKRLEAIHISSSSVDFEDRTGGRWRGTKARIAMTSMDDGLEIIIDGGTNITLKKRGVHISDFDDRLMPKVLAHGKFDNSGRLLTAYAFDSDYPEQEYRFTCRRTYEGKYKLTFPGEWLWQYNLVFQGTEQDSQPGHTARFVSFGPASRDGSVGYVMVYGADDNTLNDVSVYFQIIAL